jgi:hypothetical protein
VFDPLDLAVFLGLPLALSFVWTVVRAARRAAEGAHLEPAEAFALGAAAMLAMLLLSGQTRGEVGRIWIPIMPVLLVAALARPAADGGEGAPSASAAIWLAAAVAANTIAMACWWSFF